jgi:hypothetical protein
MSREPASPDRGPSAGAVRRAGAGGYVVIRCAPDLAEPIRRWVAEGEILKRSELSVGMLTFGYGPARGIAVSTGEIETHAAYGDVEIYLVRPSSVE